MNPADVLIPLLLAFSASALLLIIFRVIGFSWPNAALLTTIYILIFFSYGHLVRYFGDHWFPLGLIVFAVIVSYFLRRSKSNRFEKVTSLLNILSLTIVLAQVSYGTYVLVNRALAGSANSSVKTQHHADAADRPDIYLIILDAYASEELLSKKYDYDNSNFTDALKKRGFIISAPARSNYSQTLASLVSMMNMNYIDRLGMFDPTSSDRVSLARLLERSEVGLTLSALGYKTVAFATGYDLTSLESADIYLKPGFTLSEFHNIIIATTPLPYLVKTVTSLYDLRRDRISFILNKLPVIGPGRTPLFVFAHIISPHPPFVFDSEGNAIAPDREFGQGDGSHFIEQGGTREEYVNGYKSQLSYISKKILEITVRILENYGANPPVIILMGDHGPGSSLDWEEIEQTDLDERFSILNAVYLPGASPDSVVWNSPVNNFRTIFNHCFEADYELLPEHHYFSTWSQPYQFIDISGSLLNRD